MFIVVRGETRIAQFVVTPDGDVYTEIVPYVETIAVLSADGTTIYVYQQWINKFGQSHLMNVHTYRSNDAETSERSQPTYSSAEHDL